MATFFLNLMNISYLTWPLSISHCPSLPEKADLKLLQKTKIMASGPITSWQIDEEKLETVTDFIFLGIKITVDDDFSQEIKRHLLLGRKAVTNLDRILKIRDIIFANKVHYSQSYGFSSGHVQMWELDRKKDIAKELMLLNCLVGEDSWESFGQQEYQNGQSQRKSTLNIHWKDWCWSWSSKTFATWCKELTHWKRPWCWERLKERGEGNNRGWDDWMTLPTQWTWVWTNSRR